MKPDIFFVANTTAFPGWAVYRKSEDQEPRDPTRWWVRLIPEQGGVIGERITIPRACVKLKTRELHKAARAASVFNTADRLEADCVAAAKAQRAFTFRETVERYDTPA
jgi:hypothetical protein